MAQELEIDDSLSMSNMSDMTDLMGDLNESDAGVVEMDDEIPKVMTVYIDLTCTLEKKLPIIYEESSFNCD